MTTVRTGVALALAASFAIATGCGLDDRGTAARRAASGGDGGVTGAGGASTTTGAGGASTSTTGAGGTTTTSSAGGSGGTTTGAGGAGGTTTSAGGAGGTTSSAGGAGGTTSSAGGAGGTTSSAGGAGGTTSTPLEDCFNGKDDDKNGHVDCADPACAPSASCVDDPAGWDLVRFASVPFGGSQPVPCPDGSAPKVLFAEPSAAGCAACACSFSGAACSAPRISCWYYQITCSFGSSFDRQAATADCVDDIGVPDVALLSSCKLTGAPYRTAQGTCSAGGGALAPAEPWALELHVCPVVTAAKGGGCLGGQACAAKIAAAPYDGPLCVAKDGDEPCPAGYSSSSTQAYAGADDTRACSACSCDTSAITCSGGGYYAMDKGGCNGGKTLVDSGNCTGTSGELDQGSGSLLPVLAAPSQGTCAGGQPSGAVTPKGARKLCCAAP
jgi:hypothetical protein